MNYRNPLFLIIVLLMSSCQQEKTDNIITTELSQQNISATEDTSVYVDAWFPPTWNSLDSIQKNWTKLQRDSIGYFILEPLLDDNITIRLRDPGPHDVIVHWENGSESLLGFEKFTRIKPNDAFHIFAASEKEKFTCNAEIVDVENRLVLWTIESNLHGSKQFIMTPSEFEPTFRRIIETEANSDSLQNAILPLEYNSKYGLDKW